MLDAEEADSFSVSRGECLFLQCRECPLAICILYREDDVLLLCTEERVCSQEERVSLWYLQRRLTPCLERGGAVFSIQRREFPDA